MKYLLASILLLFSLFIIIPLHATTIFVDTTGYEGDSLQNAIDSAAALPGIDTIRVNNGKYHLFINDTIGLIMHDSVYLVSLSGSPGCTLSAISKSAIDTAWHVIYCDSAHFGDTASHAATIAGFTITGGCSDGIEPHNCGGGIYCYRASPDIRINNIVNNKSDYTGGGINVEYSSPKIEHNNITNCSSGYGGGIYLNYSQFFRFVGNRASNPHGLHFVE